MLKAHIYKMLISLAINLLLELFPDVHSEELQLSVPSRLFVPMKTAFRQINSGAPQDPYPRSKAALSLPLLTMNEVDTENILDDIKDGLRYVFQTKSDFTLALHGTAHTGGHAVLDNLIEKGDEVLVLINGYWGEVWANMSERLDAKVIPYKKPPGSVFSLQEIDTAIRVYRPSLVVTVPGESSTSVMQRLDGVGDVCRKYGALLVADATALVGVQPVLMDQHKIDAVFGNSHKGIGGVVGLAPIAFSPRAVQKIKHRATPTKAYQEDLLAEAQVWSLKNFRTFRFHSISLPLLYSIREALATIAEEKIENTWKRHEVTSEKLNQGLEALGLEHFVKNSKDRLIGFTEVNVPNGKDPKKIANYMFENFNIKMSTGFGPVANKVLRFVTIATNADNTKIDNILKGLKPALDSNDTNI